MKKALLLTVMTVAVLAMVAVPAFAEGYNYGGYNWTEGTDLTVYGESAGIYVRSDLGADQIQSDKGPHGGYNTTTNKCQDCHSTHYATGSYMLLRANSREDACTFCHGGGGGSSINIQMDNDYSADGVIGSATNFNGNGHTLGYTGGAPADIEPAFQDTAGLACFSCHSPHGNSARTMKVAANPGAAMDTWEDAKWETEYPHNGVVQYIWTGNANARTLVSANIQSIFRITSGPLTGWFDLNKFGGLNWKSLAVNGVAEIPNTNLWGKSPWNSNVVFRRGGAGVQPNNTANPTDLYATSRPIFVDNKWLLISNPNVKIADKDMTVFNWVRTGYSAGTADVGGGNLTLIGTPYRGEVLQLSAGDEVPNTVVQFFFWNKNGNDRTGTALAGDVYADARADVTGSVDRVRDPNRVYLEGHFTEAEVNALAADDLAWVDIHDSGVNKIAIDWKNPTGPADTAFGPDQDSDRNQPYMWSDMGLATQGGVGQARGWGSVSTFCTDCHAGAGGASTQKAKVWLPESSVESTYVVAFSHDAQPTH